MQASTILELHIMILGIDLMFRSVTGIVFTLALSIPSVIYRAKIEDGLLRNKFGEEWENYADKAGFLLPRFRRKRKECIDIAALTLDLKKASETIRY